jgi:hypothetical protein
MKSKGSEGNKGKTKGRKGNQSEVWYSKKQGE